MGEYFDSYGLEPQPALYDSMEKHSRQLRWNPNTITRLMDLWLWTFCVVYVIYRSRGIPWGIFTN